MSIDCTLSYLAICLCSQTENTIRCLNLGSYNYLGFASHDEYCTPRVIEALDKYGASACSTRIEGGEWILFLQFGSVHGAVYVFLLFLEVSHHHMVFRQFV